MLGLVYTLALAGAPLATQSRLQQSQVLRPQAAEGLMSVVDRLRGGATKCDVILVGCGVPKRGMGWYHAKQMLDGDVPEDACLRGLLKEFGRYVHKSSYAHGPAPLQPRGQAASSPEPRRRQPPGGEGTASPSPARGPQPKQRPLPDGKEAATHGEPPRPAPVSGRGHCTHTLIRHIVA